MGEFFKNEMANLERHYLFASVPNKNAKHGIRDVKSKLGKLATVTEFPLPNLRIGTLDTLMALMDDLQKHDNYVCVTTTKLAKVLVDMECDNEDEAVDAAKINLDEILLVDQAAIDPFLRKFRWNAKRWDYEKASLHSITDDIVKRANTADTALRQKMQEWVTINRSISAANSVASGSVLMRDLSGLLKEDQVINTESLTTLLVVVQKSMLKDWESQYEALEIEDLKQIMSGPFGARVVMPKSSVQVAEDSDSVLVSIVVLRRFADQIKAKLREKKFMPREYSFDKAGETKEKSLQELTARRAAARLELIKFAKAQFTELFTCWTHLKAIRVWVESVVRFSLPAEFDVMLIHPSDKRDVEKIRKELAALFKDLAAEGVLEQGKGDDGLVGMPGFVTEELYPYVSSDLLLVGRV